MQTLTLEELSLVGGTITEHCDTHILLLPVLHSECNSRAKRLLRTHNTVATVKVLAVHMHRTTLAIHIARYTT